MIKNITISNIATIKNISFATYQVNYMFGGNGSGKTTISKYLANLDNYTNGTIISDSNCDILVYNKDFVETQIAGYEGNQIHSSYELLWNEYKNPNTDAALICNTMRRILEHYFNVIGNLNYEEIIDKFSGQDKLICKTLLSYINAGSHTINDDFHLSISNEMVDKYKGVFKKIFESAGQLDHYNMMMRP